MNTLFTIPRLPIDVIGFKPFGDSIFILLIIAFVIRLTEMALVIFLAITTLVESNLRPKSFPPIGINPRFKDLVIVIEIVVFVPVQGIIAIIGDDVSRRLCE